MIDRTTSLIWAKTSREREPPTYHPLICHMVDVAAVARGLWDHVLPQALRSVLADGLALDDEATVRWVTFLAAMHDIGKATPVFQARSTPGYQRLRDVGIPFPPPAPDPGHGRLGVLLLEGMLENRLNWPRRSATQAAMAIGAHHGTFIRTGELDRLDSRTNTGQAVWAELRDSLVDDLGRLLAIDSRVARPAHVTHASGMVLAGLVSVADWIASDERLFPLAFADDDPQ